MNEKKKKLGEGYEPTLSVSTKRMNDKTEIRVRDNGSGIPVQPLRPSYNKVSGYPAWLNIGRLLNSISFFGGCESLFSFFRKLGNLFFKNYSCSILFFDFPVFWFVLRYITGYCAFLCYIFYPEALL